MFLKGFELALHKSAAFLFQGNRLLARDLGFLFQVFFVLFIQGRVLELFDHFGEIGFHLLDAFRTGVVILLDRLRRLVHFRLGFMRFVVVGKEFLHVHCSYFQFGVGSGAECHCSGYT